MGDVIALNRFYDYMSYILNLGGKPFDLSEPVVMGILNVTPDSFYAGSRKQSADAIALRTHEIIAEGGRIIDVGACSTRPGGAPVDACEELRRLRGALAVIRTEAPHVPVSVDTYRADVARACVEEYGVEIVNDISGGQGDPEMYTTIGELGVAYVLMHLEHGVEGMHQVVDYKPSVEVCVMEYFHACLERLHACGVKDVILDPGYGFSKSLEDHYRLLTHQRELLETFSEPVLVGFSRKRMVQHVIGVDAAHAADATNVLHTYVLLEGVVQIIRTHDVRLAVEAIQMTNMIRNHLPDAKKESSYTHWQRPLCH